MSAMNLAVGTGDQDLLIKNLQKPEAGVHSVVPDCRETYIEMLTQVKEAKDQTGRNL